MRHARTFMAGVLLVAAFGMFPVGAETQASSSCTGTVVDGQSGDCRLVWAGTQVTVEGTTVGETGGAFIYIQLIDVTTGFAVAACAADSDLAGTPATCHAEQGIHTIAAGNLADLELLCDYVGPEPGDAETFSWSGTYTCSSG